MLTGLLVTYLVLAPGVGLEPTTYALTAHRSTIELPGTISIFSVTLSDYTKHNRLKKYIEHLSNRQIFR